MKKTLCFFRYSNHYKWLLTDGPEQILSRAPDELKGKPELRLFSCRCERQLPETVVDAEVDLGRPLNITITITAPTSVKLGWPLVGRGGRFVSWNFTVVTEWPCFSSSAVTD